MCVYVKETDGAQGRNRTTDTAIFSRMLYQLSYLGAEPGRGPDEQSGRVIEAGFRPVQNSLAAAPGGESPACAGASAAPADADGGAEPPGERRPIPVRQHPGRIG